MFGGHTERDSNYNMAQENRVDGVYTKSCKPMIKVQKISSLSRAEKLEDETGGRVLY